MPEPEDDPIATLRRVGKIFLWPFLGSWVAAYMGSNLDVEWLYFLGLGGVGVTMLGLLVWLIR